MDSKNENMKENLHVHSSVIDIYLEINLQILQY